MNGRVLPADRPRYTVGRDAGADVPIDATVVSRLHGTIERADGGWLYRDAGSRNGSFHDGVRIGSLRIAGPVRIHLGAPDGPTLLVELIAGPAAGQVAPGQVPAGQAAARPAPAGPSAIGRLSVIHETLNPIVTIGRDEANDIVLDDLRVSRRHARLVRGPGGGVVLEDLGSQNGTFVNGRRIARVDVRDGDLVGIGGTTLRFAAGRLEEYVDQGAAWLAALGLSVVMPGGRRLLDDVSFALQPSSVLAVVGPSGAGKTTLLNALTGFRPADRGTVLYGGRDLYATYGDLRQRMGFVPQSDILHLQLTVREALSYAAELRFPADVGASDRSARVREVMTDLGLIERANLPIGRLSGGQRKRTSVGVELLTRPSLLFLDEPTSGLDPASEANLMELLVELARGGRTVVLVTHSIPSLERCDRVLYLAPGGRVAFYGAPSEVGPYFGRHGIAEGHDHVFRALEERRDTEWSAQFKADPLYETHVAGPLAMAGPGGPAATSATEAPPGRTPWLRQFAVLVRRYGTVIRRDRGVLLLLALQAPIFGLLYVLLFRANVLSTLFAIEAAVLVWLIALGATWLGTSNAIREIVKELPIYQRERSIGLSTSAYVTSKVAVLATVTVVQTVVMTAIALTTQHLPPDDPASYGLLAAPIAASAGIELPDVSFDGRGAFLGDAYIELFIGAALTGIAAMALALFVSAVARATDRAATMLPILLIVQTVVSAPLLGLPPPGLREVGLVSTTQWGFSALASTVDLNDIRAPFLAVQEILRSQARGVRYVPARTERAAWEHDADTWRADIAALVALTLVSVLGAWFALRRLDPHAEARRTARGP